jgi:acetylornithine deacetylase/succinyl-diaminopimelate desuccinylase-like protein
MSRVIAEAGCDFPGSLLITVYGLHEAPLGQAETLVHLIENQVVGDAALVMEGTPGQVSVCGKGQSIWDLHVKRTGKVCHELRRDDEADALVDAVLSLSLALREQAVSLSAAEHEYPLLGPESIFIGQIHYGDFYNRVPTTAALQGTRRWHPDKSFDLVRSELHSLVQATPCGEGVRVDEDWTFVGESYDLDPEEPIVHALRSAHRELSGDDLPIGGVSSITDTNRLVPMGGVPTVNISFDGGTAHGDRETVRLSALAESTRIGLLTALGYLEGAVR